MIWPWWVQALLGAGGLSWCLDTWTKLRTRPPWAPGSGSGHGRADGREPGADRRQPLAVGDRLNPPST